MEKRNEKSGQELGCGREGKIIPTTGGGGHGTSGSGQMGSKKEEVFFVKKAKGPFVGDYKQKGRTPMQAQEKKGPRRGLSRNEGGLLSERGGRKEEL